MAVFFFNSWRPGDQRDLLGHAVQLRPGAVGQPARRWGHAGAGAIYAASTGAMRWSLRGWAIPTGHRHRGFALGILAAGLARAGVAEGVPHCGGDHRRPAAPSWSSRAVLAPELSLPMLRRGGCGCCACCAEPQPRRRRSAYVVVGALVWLCLLKSGVHATLAMGVETGWRCRLARRRQRRSPRPRRARPAPSGESLCCPFAFANAGVSLQGVTCWPPASAKPCRWASLPGLVAGKADGGGRVADRRLAGPAFRPRAVGERHLERVPAGGVGFAMSLFIGGLAPLGRARPTKSSSSSACWAASLVSALLGAARLMLKAARRGLSDRP